MAAGRVVAAQTLDATQRAAVSFAGNVVVNACPGSGKTTLVVGKVIHELSRNDDTARAVLCLTFTRAAVRSIKDKLRSAIGDPDIPGCIVATIHGFVLRQIFRPYSHLAGFPYGLRLLGPTSPEYENVAVAAFPNRPRVVDKLRYVRRAVDGSAITTELHPDRVHKFWALLEEAGFIDFPSLLYYGAKLLIEYDWIAVALSARYRTIIVDEYQDTGDVALAILEQLRTPGTSTFLLVGDPRQRIYSFAGVSTESLKSFADSLCAERLGLTGSYRCGAAICRDGSSLLPKMPPFHSNRDVEHDDSITELLVAPSTYDAIEKYFLSRLVEFSIQLKDAAILSSGSAVLVELGKSLRQAGVPVTGGPTRPYPESFLSQFAEALAAFARRPISRNWRIMEDGFFQLFGEVEDESVVEQFPGEVGASLNFASSTALMLGYTRVVDILDLIIADLLKLADIVESPGLRFVRDEWSELRPQLLALYDVGTVLAEQIDSTFSITLSTIHGAKGLEYRAIALVQFNNGVLPHAKSHTVAAESEDLRKVFVAATRAMDYVLYVSDREDVRNKTSRFASRLLANRARMR
jgi:DNA helicase II / ATP-dependent DNA helicase PcrA